MVPPTPPPPPGNILVGEATQRKHEQQPSRAERRRAARATAKEAERRRAARELTARKIATLPDDIQKELRRGYGALILEEITFISALAAKKGEDCTDQGRAYIAEKVDCSIRTVTRWVTKFVKLKLLTSIQRPPRGWNRWQTNLTILSEKLARWTRSIYRNLKVSHYPGTTDKSGDSGTLPPDPPPKEVEMPLRVGSLSAMTEHYRQQLRQNAGRDPATCHS